MTPRSSSECSRSPRGVFLHEPRSPRCSAGKGSTVNPPRAGSHRRASRCRASEQKHAVVGMTAAAASSRPADPRHTVCPLINTPMLDGPAQPRKDACGLVTKRRSASLPASGKWPKWLAQRRRSSPSAMMQDGGYVGLKLDGTRDGPTLCTIPGIVLEGGDVHRSLLAALLPSRSPRPTLAQHSNRFRRASVSGLINRPLSRGPATKSWSRRTRAGVVAWPMALCGNLRDPQRIRTRNRASDSSTRLRRTIRSNRPGVPSTAVTAKSRIALHDQQRRRHPGKILLDRSSMSQS
jgi:hypothetical protein